MRLRSWLFRSLATLDFVEQWCLERRYILVTEEALTRLLDDLENAK